MKHYQLRFEVTSNKDFLLKLLKFFKHCEWLGMVGSSRRVSFFCDGDGNERPYIYVLKNGEPKEVGATLVSFASAEDKEMLETEVVMEE